MIYYLVKLKQQPDKRKNSSYKTDIQNIEERDLYYEPKAIEKSFFFIYPPLGGRKNFLVAFFERNDGEERKHGKGVSS
jgi:hypothetical protein